MDNSKRKHLAASAWLKRAHVMAIATGQTRTRAHSHLVKEQKRHRVFSMRTLRRETATTINGDDMTVSRKEYSLAFIEP